MLFVFWAKEPERRDERLDVFRRGLREGERVQ